MSLHCYFVLILFAGAYYGSGEGLLPNRIQVKSVYDALHDSLPNSIEPKMIWVEGGTFSIGSESGETDERPVHTVELDGYYMGKYEITQAQWKAVMGNNPSTNRCDRCPVESVSWNDVQEFVSTLNTKTGKTYHLPTEAEWECAARGGQMNKDYTYAGSNDLGSLDFFHFNGATNTHFVGGKLANELGIYNMSGQVSECCSDWFGAYSAEYVKSPKGAQSGDSKIIRGGRWSYNYSLCRISNRSWSFPDNKSGGLGFRLALSPDNSHTVHFEGNDSLVTTMAAIEPEMV